MRIYYDLESTGLLDSSSIDYTQIPYRLKDSFKIHCLVAEDADTGQIYKFYQDSVDEIKTFFENVTEVIGHNIISYDNLVLRLYFGLHFKVGYDGQETLNGKPCKITDTLTMSRMLNPDRRGGHSLKSWGIRLGILKGDFADDNDWETFSQEMLDYCVQDVAVTKATYKALCKEWGEWDWSDAYQLEKQVQYITTQQEHFGFYFDSDLAERCLDELETWLKEIEEKVEPQLPKKPISKTNAKKYIPPKVQFKKNGQASANLEKFVEKHGGVWIGEREVELFGKTYELPLPREPLVEEEPMTLANQIELKKWLVSAGWEPLVWGEKELTLDSKKQKLPRDKFVAAVERYVEETLNGPYLKFRCERVKCKPWELREKLLSHDMNRPLKVYTSPKYTINQDKEVDPNLVKMGEKYSFVEDVVKWLTYRHRRNSILSPNGTGFLKHVREDGRIPTPANPCGATSSRYQHAVVANIPRATSLYGENMRSMFGAKKPNYQIGYDFSGLEARIEGHYTVQFNGGDEYAKDLVAEKPNDIHTKHAKMNGITRDEQKTLKYSCTYGAQPPKIAKQMGWSTNRAKSVFESFWESAKPLATLKERVTTYWKKRGGKQFVRAIDGRKLWVRSEHSIVNIVFQSAGVICAKRANVIHHKWLEEKGLLFDPFADSSFSHKCHLQIHYHDEAQWEVDQNLVKNGESSIVGELASKASQEAGKYYGLRVDLDADYDIGRNWKDCH